MGRVGLIIAAILLLAAPARAAETEQFAADELKRYLALTKAHPRKIELSVDPKLGDGDEAVSILVDSTHIKIVGSTGHAALTGAYGVLDLAGWRFLSPSFDFYQGAAEVNSGQDKLNLGLKIEGSKPTLKFRKLYVEEGHSHTPENLAQLVEWMPKVGFNTLVVPTNYQGHDRVKWDNFRARVTPECQKRGITIEVGGHGYQNFLNASMEGGKLFDQHPDWFGQDATGKRVQVPQRVFCTSNTQAVDYLIAQFSAYVKERPEIQIYDFWPPDGAKWCECSECAKLGSPSDRQAILMKQVQAGVKSVRPDLRLEMIAYASALQPPQHEKVDKSILVDFCPIGQQFDHQINDPTAAKNKEYVDALTAWRKAFDGDISIYSYYRKYAWDSLPVIIPHYMQKDLQFYATLPVQGVSSYSEPADWGTYELNHYVLAALAWNPDADVDALVKKFCATRYGDNAVLAADALETLGDLTRTCGSIPNSSLKSAEQIDKALIDERNLSQQLAAAEKKATGSVQQALHRLGLTYAYAISDLEIQQLRAKKATKAEISAKADTLHQWLAEHAEEGVFLVKDQRISPARMMKRYDTTKKSG